MFAQVVQLSSSLITFCMLQYVEFSVTSYKYLPKCFTNRFILTPQLLTQQVSSKKLVRTPLHVINTL